MFRNRASTVWFLVWAGLLLASFRPVAVVERVFDLLLAPLRYAAELAAPLELLRARSASAAERTLASRAEAEASEGAAALTTLAARALPADPELRGERRFVHGEVTDRPDKDHCSVVVLDGRGVEPGCPVVSGDAFVGRVTEVGPGEAGAAVLRVDLVTARSFRIGAVVAGEEEVFLAAGGVHARSRGRGVRLVAHQPSSSALAGGLARVHELFAEAGDPGRLAEGFRLGEVHREGARGPWWIEPELDYLDGLFQVAIVTRADPSLPEAPPFEPALRDARWLPTRALTFGDPSPWRSTVKIPLGRGAGASVGAAVTGVGARLLGRVIRTGITTSDVALLSDPGFTLAAVALLDGEPEPRILGRLTTLGRDGGRIRLRWWVRVPLDAAGDATEPAAGEQAVRARIFTGSGDPGLPAGLFLGEANLPRSARPGEELEIFLQTEIDPADVRRYFVREVAAPAELRARNGRRG